MFMNATTEQKKQKDQKNIDEKHTDIMNTFYVIENHTIPKLQEDKKNYKKHLLNPLTESIIGE